MNVHFFVFLYLFMVDKVREQIRVALTGYRWRLWLHIYTNGWPSLFRLNLPLSSIRPIDFREVLPLEKKPVRNPTVFAYTILGAKSYLKSGAIFNSVQYGSSSSISAHSNACVQDSMYESIYASRPNRSLISSLTDDGAAIDE